MTQRYKLTIEYIGTGYYGWQRQPDYPTIQGAIEEAILKFSGQKVNVQSAGRTDAGVHAWAQIAHVDFEDFKNPMQPYVITKAINSYLRDQPISIVHTEKVEEDFHARFSAKNKLYVYRILNRQAAPTIDLERFWHIKRPLDVTAMHEAAQCLLGEHDFTTFRDSQCQAKSPVRQLDRLAVTAHEYDPYGGVEVRIEAEGMSFLHHMVRNIAGTLTRIGEGKWNAEDLVNALEAKDRARGGQTAPAHGLYLKRIDYQK